MYGWVGGGLGLVLNEPVGLLRQLLGQLLLDGAVGGVLGPGLGVILVVFGLFWYALQPPRHAKSTIIGEILKEYLDIQGLYGLFLPYLLTL